jgi:hypothetical protein
MAHAEINTMATLPTRTLCPSDEGYTLFSTYEPCFIALPPSSAGGIALLTKFGVGAVR